MAHPVRSLFLASYLVALVACGGSGDSSGGLDDRARVTISPDGGVGFFDPGTVVVAAGGSVTWENRSGVDHNVVFDDETVKSSSLFGDGRSFTTSFARSGSFGYVCTIHPGMVGTVVVE